MPLSQLSIFSINTDANSTIKGYEYQKLKTLEAWLKNKVDGVNELIYCEYEDDIFQRNIVSGKSLFRQIKLYSSKPFSFDSEEVKKSLANFFMLYVKGEYSFDKVNFVFESNTAIAKKYLQNDSELLKQWNEHQGDLSEELLNRCADKLKAILSNYIKEEFPAAQKRDKSAAQAAKIVFDNISDGTWQDFAKTIRWVFSETDSNTVIETSINNIRFYIGELPFPSVESKTDNIFTTLYYEVSEKMFQDEPEHRFLTNSRLDSLILDLGDDADKQYNITYKAWVGVSEIRYFHPAEFFEVLHAANHCRWEIYLVAHGDFWKSLLRLFIEANDTPTQYKVKALYEFLWIQLRPSITEGPQGSFKGHDRDIELYYDLALSFDGHEAVSDHFSLLQIIRAAILFGVCDITIDTVNDWSTQISNIIKQKLDVVINPSERCYWLELKAQLYILPAYSTDSGEDLTEVENAIYDIVKLLPGASFYNVTRLSDRITQTIKMLNSDKGAANVIESLADLVEKLIPYVSSRNGNYIAAKTYINLGSTYLNTTNPINLGKALEAFHKAKDLWMAAETVEGHILALLNIAQLYLALKMDYAARYYILSAAWIGINSDPDKFAKRIASAFGLLVHCDFKVGAWIHALASFKYYMTFRHEFDPTPIGKDKLLGESYADAATILHFSPILSPELTVLIQNEKRRMGVIYTDFIEPLSKFVVDIAEDEGAFSFFQQQLHGPALNDIGPTRTIAFKAFGTQWRVTFANAWRMESLSEEYIAILQILLVELSYSSIDLHFIRTTIEIEIVESLNVKQPEQLPSNTHFKWKIYATYADAKEITGIRTQMASILVTLKFILREISQLKDDSFFNHVDELFQSKGLAQKTLTGALYQRISRMIFTQDVFDFWRRNHFTNVDMTYDLKEDVILQWNQNPSQLYSKEKALEFIEGRIKNCNKQLNLTISHLKGQNGYQKFINDLRSEGWLDWQIIMAMYNHVLSYKANRLIDSQRPFASDSAHSATMKKAFFDVQKMEEKDTFIAFPLSFFIDQSQGFQFSLEQVAHSVLRTWGLESRSKFPNFPAIKDLLNKRFNFGTDDLPNLTLL